MITNVGDTGKVYDARVLRGLGLYCRGKEGTLFPRNDVVIYSVSGLTFILGHPTDPFLTWLMKLYPTLLIQEKENSATD